MKAAPARCRTPPIVSSGTSPASMSCCSAPAIPSICAPTSLRSSSRPGPRPTAGSSQRYSAIWLGWGWTRRISPAPAASFSLAPLASACGERVGVRGRSVRVDDRAQHDAALLGVVVAGAAVHRRPLVPNQQIADLPGMVIGKAFLRGVRGEFLDQLPGLLAAHPLEAVRVHRVDEQDRAAGDRMVDHRRARLLDIFLVGPAHLLLRIVQARAGRPIGAAMQPDEAG